MGVWWSLWWLAERSDRVISNHSPHLFIGDTMVTDDDYKPSNREKGKRSGRNKPYYCYGCEGGIKGGCKACTRKKYRNLQKQTGKWHPKYNA